MKQKGAPKYGPAHKIILAVLIGIMAVSGYRIAGKYIDDWNMEREYKQLAQMVKEETTAVPEPRSAAEPEEETEQEEETEAPYVSPIDFEALAQINPDVVGWITIPDTNIDYPIVQSQDNDTYLRKSFEGESTAAGSIFLDFESQSDMEGYNNIIYGHHMKNGSMFKDVVEYKDEQYFKDHQYFEIYTPKETIHLKAVSCYYIENDPMVRKTKFHDDDSFQAFVREMLEPCEYAEIPQDPVSRLFVLVTCSYEVEDGRTVLFAVETGEEKETAR